MKRKALFWSEDGNKQLSGRIHLAKGCVSQVYESANSMPSDSEKTLNSVQTLCNVSIFRLVPASDPTGLP